MKFTEFYIYNFKSIEEIESAKVSDDNITVLAGQNESWKTSVLEALSFFSNWTEQLWGDDYFTNHYQKDTSNLTIVCCRFLLNWLDLNDIFKENSKKIKIDSLIISKEVELQRDFDTTAEPISLSYDYKTWFKNTMKPFFTIASESEWSSAELDLALQNFTKYIIERIPKFNLYKWFNNLLPAEIKVSNIPENEAVKDFELLYWVDLKKIASESSVAIRRDSLDELSWKFWVDFNNAWKQRLDSVEQDKYQFKVEVNMLQNNEQSISFLVKWVEQKSLYFDQKSQWFQWFSSFYLRILALKKKYKNNNIILLIDEPGQNLHDTAQFDVKHVMEELANSGIQIIYSTHSANLIDTDAKWFSRIRLVSNLKWSWTLVETIPQYASRADNGKNLDTFAPIRKAMWLASLDNFLHKGGINLITEGVTEKYYIEAFKELLHKKEKKLQIIPAIWVTNVSNIVSIFLWRGYTFKVLLDDDAKGRGVYKELSDWLYSIDKDKQKEQVLRHNWKGIEDVFSVEDFKKYVLPAGVEFDNTKNNASQALNIWSKELQARVFLQKVYEWENITLSKQTLDNVSKIFTFVYSQSNE